MEAWRFAKLQHAAERHGWTRFVSMQPQYNLLYREEEREMLPLCLDQGVGVIPWSPLARGRLTRDWQSEDTNRAQTDAFARQMFAETEHQDHAVFEAVSRIAAERGTGRAQVALAWMLTKPAITAPIVGATKPQHLADAIAALTVTLTAEDIAALEAPYVPHAISGMVPPLGSAPQKLTLKD
jgi:aryl-alcohol dehydrogenase-like predicted oxidoreductase